MASESVETIVSLEHPRERSDLPKWWRRRRARAKADPPKGSKGRSAPSRPPAASGPAKGTAAKDEAPARPEVPPEPSTPESPAKPPGQPSDAPPQPPDASPEPTPDAPPVDAKAGSTRSAQPPEAVADRASEPPAKDEARDEGGVELSLLADRVQALLEAAEATAEHIRRDAEADAARVTEERARQRHAARELRHLERLADSLSVQAEAVKRQCGVLKNLLPPVGDDDGSAAAALAMPELGEAETALRVRDLRTEGDRAGASENDGADPENDGRRYPEISRERVEAYRMKLAGASRAEVVEYLTAAGIDDPAEVAADLFERRDATSPVD